MGVFEASQISESRKAGFVTLDVPHLGRIKGSVIQYLGGHPRRFVVSGILTPDREHKKAILESDFETGQLTLNLPGIGDVFVITESLEIIEEEGDIPSYRFNLRLVEV